MEPLAITNNDNFRIIGNYLCYKTGKKLAFLQPNIHFLGDQRTSYVKSFEKGVAVKTSLGKYYSAIFFTNNGEKFAEANQDDFSSHILDMDISVWEHGVLISTICKDATYYNFTFYNKRNIKTQDFDELLNKIYRVEKRRKSTKKNIEKEG